MKKMSLDNVVVSVILFVLKIRKNMTFNNVADFMERVTNKFRKKHQPLHIVISDLKGIVVAKAVHCYDIKEMYRVPRKGDQGDRCLIHRQ